MRIIILIILLLGNWSLLFCKTASQTAVKEIDFSTSNGLSIRAFIQEDKNRVEVNQAMPFFTVDINDSTLNSIRADAKLERKQISFHFSNNLAGTLQIQKNFAPGWKGIITFINNSPDTVKLANVVPFGKSDDHIYLTASGSWSLARTKIFRPGLGPVGVVLPDNAWETGYGAITISTGISYCAIARRTKTKDGTARRWWTLLPPGSSVEYAFYVDGYTGEWQNGLRLMFQDRYLYDLEKFDNHLYEREDLAWIRHQYVITTQMAWDHDFYDARDGGYTFARYLDMGKKYFGNWDSYIFWPTWPTLGLDQRNQWDLYKDIPGGVNKIKALAEEARSQGTRFFISYNPWDQSTRKMDPYKGMEQLIRATSADGVILDTYGSSNRDLQAAADRARPGVVMYSEGMAVPKDMPTIITGRVHDAIFMPPPVNLNKFIKPDNAIFRVCQLNDGEMHRETSISFFNGYGVEINVYRPGRPAWMDKEYGYLGTLVMILRDNSSAFLSKDWTPLLPTLRDSIWVNKWPEKKKTVYTVFSLLPAGFNGPLFEAPVSPDSHYVSLYHHEELKLDSIGNKTYIRVKTNSFDKSWLNTRKEGNVDCVARFPNLLKVKLKMDSLSFSAQTGDLICIWKGMPSYQNEPKIFKAKSGTIKLLDEFGRYEGKFVIQLLENNELIDEKVVELKMQTPRLISRVQLAFGNEDFTKDMIFVQGSDHYFFKNEGASGIIPYPDFPEGKEVRIRSFYMDKYPVTNAQFKKFMDETNYLPEDSANFLKHWKNGTYPEGQGNYPVVYVCLEDARAYASWAGKRLPTEVEWQYAAQGSDTLEWPWGAEFDSTLCNSSLGHPTSVGAFPGGASPSGVMDLVGNVWQLTNDEYDDGSYYFIIIRGGSYYNPTSSWWYVKGGPQPLNKTQMLLRVSPGFERNATVGFRCVVDTE